MKYSNEVSQAYNRLRYQLSETDCWECYSHAIGGGGYPVIGIARKLASIHRVSYLHHYGDIPEGMVIMHTCDNKLCYNPQHLKLATQKENMQDAKIKKRNAHGIRNGMNKLTEAQVLEIRNAGGRQKDIAAKYGVCQRTVNKILNKINWSHL